MRTAIAELLANDHELNLLGINEDTIFAGDIDTVDQTPFVNLRWGVTNPGVATVNDRGLVVWVHDQPNDYFRVDQILRRVRELLTSIYALKTGTGWITEIRWLTDSDDLSDDGNHTILRQASYSIIGSGT